jgi:hypothetical protein
MHTRIGAGWMVLVSQIICIKCGSIQSQFTLFIHEICNLKSSRIRQYVTKLAEEERGEGKKMKV